MGTNTESLVLANLLREKGIKVIIEMNNRKLGKVFEKADKNNIPFVIVLGENELNENSIEIKNMYTGEKTKAELNDIEKIYSIVK